MRLLDEIVPNKTSNIIASRSLLELQPSFQSHLGLPSMRMLEGDGAPDALFFHQLLLPIHNSDKTVPDKK